MTTFAFRSSLAHRMTDFVTFKRLQEFQYAQQIKKLRYFDTFLVQHHFSGSSLSRDIVDAYLEHTSTYKANTRYSRLSIVRDFSRYLSLYESDSYVLYELTVKRPRSPRFYIYSEKEIRKLITKCSCLKPLNSSKPITFRTLIGLIAVTGLRINEALSLNLGDFHLQDALIFIRKGKFSKDRWVPLAASTAQALTQYLAVRKQTAFSRPEDPLFLGRGNKRLSYGVVCATFRNLIKTCKIGPASPQAPRIHDLRHTYATKCLLKWYQQGGDISTKLPVLATCMGHVSIASTQLYLHLTPELMAHAQHRFFSTFTKHLENHGGRS